MPENKEKDLELKRILQTLEKSDIVFVPTDKTNKYESMEEYCMKKVLILN